VVEREYALYAHAAVVYLYEIQRKHVDLERSRREALVTQGDVMSGGTLKHSFTMPATSIARLIHTFRFTKGIGRRA
jgi:hypothetical protein